MKQFFPKTLKFDRRGLIPVIVQDYRGGEVLMMAYMNKEAIRKTYLTGKSHFWSRSRQQLWMKGETSGHIQLVRAIYYDCDYDTLLLKVEQRGVACHMGRRSCFFNKIPSGLLHMKVLSRKEGVSQKGDPSILERVASVIRDRKRNPQKSSYVSFLFQGGQDRVLKKITEEAGELVIGSKNRKRREIIYEMADLWFHCLVVLGYHGISLSKLWGELENRFGQPGLLMKREALAVPSRARGAGACLPDRRASERSARSPASKNKKEK